MKQLKTNDVFIVRKVRVVVVEAAVDTGLEQLLQLLLVALPGCLDGLALLGFPSTRGNVALRVRPVHGKDNTVPILSAFHPGLEQILLIAKQLICQLNRENLAVLALPVEGVPLLVVCHTWAGLG